jgi:hypothetical protein
MAPLCLALLLGVVGVASGATAPDIEAFQDAIVAGDLDRLDVLLAEVKAAGAPLPTTDDGTSLLHKACHWYSPDRAAVVTRVLAAGGDVRAVSADGRTPLHFAGNFDCAPCAKALLAAGADTTARDHEGGTPLHGAGRSVVPLLLAAGADPLARDHAGNVPLHRTLDPALRAAGVDVRNDAGLTPLHFAALVGSVPAIEWLLADGADPTLRTTARTWYRASFMSPTLGPGMEIPKGSTPLDLAKLQERTTRWSTSRYQPVVTALATAHLRPRFEDFLGRFRTALARNDAVAVADLTRLPFLYEGQERARTAFVRIYPELFTDTVRGCLRHTAPQVEGDRHVVFCGAYAFYFGWDRSDYRLLEFGADGEDM